MICGQNELPNALNNQTSIISEDDYYHDPNTANHLDFSDGIFDNPVVRDHALLLSHLVSLRDGEDINMPQYDFVVHRRCQETKTLTPSKVIIIEGIHVFCDEALRQLFDFKVFLDIDDNIRFDRRLRRDIAERGRTKKSVEQQYIGVRAAYNQYIEPTRDYADLIISDEFSDNVINKTASNIMEKSNLCNIL